MTDGPTIFLTAAEASGDAHAAGLIAALRRRLGEVRLVGIGGARMAAAGCELLEDTVVRASMLTGVLGQLAYYRRVIRRVAAAMDEHRPAAVVPVDSPALNWLLSGGLAATSSSLLATTPAHENISPITGRTRSARPFRRTGVGGPHLYPWLDSPAWNPPRRAARTPEWHRACSRG